MDTRDKLFDWVERRCVTEDDPPCIEGKVKKSFVDLDILDLSDATEYTVTVSGWVCVQVTLSLLGCTCMCVRVRVCMRESWF